MEKMGDHVGSDDENGRVIPHIVPLVELPTRNGGSEDAEDQETVPSAHSGELDHGTVVVIDTQASVKSPTKPSKKQKKRNPMANHSFRRSLFFRRNSAPEVEEPEEDGKPNPEKEQPRHTDVDIDARRWWSWVFLSWISSLVGYGYRYGKIEKEDLWNLREHDDPELISQQVTEALEHYRDPETGSFTGWGIWKALGRVFYRDLVLGFVLEMIFAALRFAGPVILRLLVIFIGEEIGQGYDHKGYLLGFALFATQALGSLCGNHSRFLALKIGLRAKSGLSLVTFKHVLNLDQEGRQQMSQGQVINLVSTDAQMPVELMRMWNRFLTAPFILIAGVVYIYLYIGVSVFLGLLVLVVFVPLSVRLANVQTRLQRNKMKQTDVRVKLVSEMLQGIKVLKLNAWEAPLLKQLGEVRDQEMRDIKWLHYFRGLTLPLAVALPNVASVIAFGAYILLGNEITPANTFAVVSAFVIIRTPFVTFPMAITLFSRAIVSANRFAKFFSLKTRKGDEARFITDAAPMNKNNDDLAKSFRDVAQNDDDHVDMKLGSDDDDDLAVVAKDANFSWSEVKEGKTRSTFHLKNINIEVKKGELIAIIGKIGDGKSSLISALLGDMKAISGSVKVRGNVMLCQQEPFIMNRTVRENILFGLPFDEEWYNQTLHVCALSGDLETLPSGDLTEIGERGVNLSGGQKARVSLARAVYARHDAVQDAVFFLDDILSAVDAHVCNHIFEECISNKPGSALRGTTRLFVSNQLHLLEQVDRIIILREGTILDQGTYTEIMERGRSSLLSLIEEKGENEAEKEEEEEEEKDSATVGVVEKKSPPAQRIVENATADAISAKKGLLVKAEERNSGTMSFRVLAAYWLAGALNSWFLVSLVLFSFVLTEAVFLSIDSWLAEYSQQPEGGPISEKLFLTIYFSLTGAFFIILLLRALVFAAFSIEACRVLYENLQENIFYLPMSFFWQTPLGRVINRLSKDTNDIDVMITMNFQWFLMTVVRVLGILAVISWSAPIFLVAIGPFILLYYAIREYYRKTAVSCQRTESVLRSPVFSQLSETFTGATTIRVFGNTARWLARAQQLIADNFRAHFAVEAVQVWLSLRMEFLGALVVFVTAICLVATEAEPGLAGLALSYVLNITINLNMTVIQSTQVESKLNAVERVVEYSELKNEKTEDMVDIPEGWPNSGSLEFKGATLRYRDDLEPAIKDLNISIKSGERVGIVGKTGSGKSTISVALFRLRDICGGSIILDGVNILDLSVHKVRANISAIPQDPVLFSTTLRKNIDPFEQHTDEEVWQAIDKAHLRSVVENMPDKLESNVVSGGENLSVGQRQLVCIARAALRKAKVIMLDEATASIDSETDALIQETIRTSFPDCTMLIIAHRIKTILDLDKVLVMDNGEVAEYDSITALLEKPNGMFRSLAKAAKM